MFTALAKNVIRVGNLVANPGQTVKGRLEVGRFADSSMLTIPVMVVNGTGEGPTLYIQAACHGVELNGIEVLRRLVATISPSQLRGALIVVPVANVVAFTHRTRQTHWDLEDMNRVWPGKPNGNMSQRMAHVLYQAGVAQADYLIDLHTGSGTMVTHIRMATEGESGILAQVFGTELLVKEAMDEGFKERRYDGKLRIVADQAGIPGITPELGGHSRLQEEIVQVGLRGVRNVMKHLAMIDGQLELPPEQTVVSYDSNSILRATLGGLFVAAVTPGQRVQAGQEIGRLYDVATFDTLEVYRAPYDGLVMLYTEDPVRHFGDSIATIARLEGVIQNA